MGMSSSQARLLNLTARMHQIEYKAAKLEAQKLQMANESSRVYNDYLNALDKTKIQMKTLENDGSVGYVDATYNKLIEAGYKITFLDSSFEPTMSKYNDYTKISSYEDLKKIGSTGKYVLTNDITVPAGENWTPITYFGGTIDGNGHIIKNLYINGGSTSEPIAFIGSSASGMTIKNLGFQNANIIGGDNSVDVAVIVADMTNAGTIEHCWVDGANISNSDCDAGGIVSATGVNPSIHNCYTKNITFSNISLTPGDIVGAASGNDDIQYCYSTTSNQLFGRDGSPGSTIKKVSDSELNSLIANGTLGYSSEANEADNHLDDTTWLTNLINSGAIIISKKGEDGNHYDTSVSTDTNLQEVADEKNLKKAEAKYEADMKRIDMKDRKYDADLAALDTERNAIKQEMETLKTVAKDNVDRTFKLFS